MGRTVFIIACVLAVMLPPPTMADTRVFGDKDSVEYNGVWDGDTFYATIPGWPSIIGDSIKVRISAINCHEYKTSQDSTHPAKMAKALTGRILESAKVISLKNLRRGGFFRIIADVQVDGEDLGEMLVKQGLALECDQRCDKCWVWVTRAGGSYHMKTCRHVAGSEGKYSIPVEEAMDRNLNPCKVCDPPGFEEDKQ